MLPHVSWTELASPGVIVATREAGKQADGNASNLEVGVTNRFARKQSKT